MYAPHQRPPFCLVAIRDDRYTTFSYLRHVSYSSQKRCYRLDTVDNEKNTKFFVYVLLKANNSNSKFIVVFIFNFISASSVKIQSKFNLLTILIPCSTV